MLFTIIFSTLSLPSVLWRCWLGGRKGIRPVKTEWWGAGMVICLEWGADLHMAQLMPLPLTVSCFSKIQIGFTFLVPAHLGSPQGSFPVRKRTGTLRIWRAWEREPIWGSGGQCPQQGPGAEPLVRGAKSPEAEGILLPKRPNLSLWNLNFAAICRKGPERRSGDQKKNRNGIPVCSGSKRTLVVPDKGPLNGCVFCSLYNTAKT